MSLTGISANRLELLQIANAVAMEKSIDKEIVIEAIEDAIQKAARSRYGAEHDIRAHIDPKTGEVRSVNWYAPALNTVFYRFSKEEVRFILNYGRPFSPMSAWGAPGGGPMTAQNIETLHKRVNELGVAEPVIQQQGTDRVVVQLDRKSTRLNSSHT